MRAATGVTLSIVCLLIQLAEIKLSAFESSIRNMPTHPESVSKPDIIQTLFETIKNAQVKSEKNFILPPLFWKERKGIYGSYVKFNFHGAPGLHVMREVFQVFDNNMFVTAWITISLLEAYKYWGAPKPSDEQIRLSVEAIGQYHDRNRAQPNAILTFWPEAYNETTASWQSAPENLFALFNMTDHVPWKVIEDILKLFGLDVEAEVIQGLLDSRSSDLKAFHIPPDFDDTSVNLGLGALLTEFQDDFPQSYQLWLSQNSNLETIWTALKTYAYRPLSNNVNVNTIDSRTYFYMRGFLEAATQAGKDIALVPTWIQDIAEVANMSKRGVGMPFNINNVDVTVSANAIFGITSAVMSGLVSKSVLQDDLDLQKIYLNTSSMLVWEIQRDFVERKDLALTYYPSAFELYWFISRTYALLERHVITNQTLPTVFEEVRTTFRNVLRGHVTDVIIGEAQFDGNGEIFYDDFLGDADVTSDGKPEVRGEDRIFTTAMAVNALGYTWSTIQPLTNQNHWVNGTPAGVISTVQKASAWLERNTLSRKYKPWNAFFSGSYKGFDTLPFWYPFNRIEFLNGTKIPLNTTKLSGDLIFGMEGVVSPQSYNTMLNQKHFGVKTPLTFKGYNATNSSFPFWMSETYTYSSTLLALAQAQSLSNSTQPSGH